MKYIYLILLTFFVSSCAQLPPTPQDIQAKKFETVPDKAVIYVVRPRVDGPVDGPLSFTGGMISTHPGTYYRWEAAPGAQRIEGTGATSVAITLQAEAGKLYFIEQTAIGNPRDGLQSMSLRRIDDNRGRKMVGDATLL